MVHEASLQQALQRASDITAEAPYGSSYPNSRLLGYNVGT